MNKKLSPAASAGIIAGAIILCSVVGYMAFFRGSTGSITPTESQAMQVQVMKMSPEEQRRFGEAHILKQAEDERAAREAAQGQTP